MDWIGKEAERIRKYLADRLYVGREDIMFVLDKGIEEVRGLRKENERLEEICDEYQEEKEKLEERLEKEKAELDWERNEYLKLSVDYWSRLCELHEKEMKTLRDEFALEFMARNGNSAMAAYKRADEMMKARNKETQ